MIYLFQSFLVLPEVETCFTTHMTLMRILYVWVNGLDIYKTRHIKPSGKKLSGCYDSLMGSSTIADSSLISFVFLENSSNGQIGYSQ